MKKILIIIMILCMPLIVNANELAANAKSGILMEYSTGTVLYEKNSKEKMAPASMTKIMTLLLIMEAVDDGKLTLDEMVTISPNAASMGGSQVYLEAGSQIKAEELIKSIFVASANDSSVAMAERISGTTGAFVKKMNDKAKSLGCQNTNFVNVHGLDEENHYSCAYDMAVIAKELMKYDSIFKYTTIYETYLTKPDGTSTWMVNTNKLIKYYNGLDGLKTGFTDKAGYCLTSTAKRNDMRLITVLMNEPTSNIRNEETIELLNYGFSNYKIKTILDTKKDLGKVKVLNGKEEYVNIKLVKDATSLENLNEEKEYTYNIKVDDIKAPVKSGDVVGYLEVVQNGIVIDYVDITVSKSIKKANLWDLFKRNLSAILVGN